MLFNSFRHSTRISLHNSKSQNTQENFNASNLRMRIVGGFHFSFWPGSFLKVISFTVYKHVCITCQLTFVMQCHVLTVMQRKMRMYVKKRKYSVWRRHCVECMMGRLLIFSKLFPCYSFFDCSSAICCLP